MKIKKKLDYQKITEPILLILIAFPIFYIVLCLVLKLFFSK